MHKSNVYDDDDDALTTETKTNSKVYKTDVCLKCSCTKWEYIKPDARETDDNSRPTNDAHKLSYLFWFGRSSFEYRIQMKSVQNRRCYDGVVVVGVLL